MKQRHRRPRSRWRTRRRNRRAGWSRPPRPRCRPRPCAAPRRKSPRRPDRHRSPQRRRHSIGGRASDCASCCCGALPFPVMSPPRSRSCRRRPVVTLAWLAGASDASAIVLARQNVLRGLPGSSSTKVEGAERRQALGCLRGTRSRASDAGPQGEIARALRPRADQLAQSAQPGDARLSALHRGDLLAPVPRGMTFGRCTARRCHRLRCILASARSGGGRCFPAPPGSVVTSHARRTPHPAPTLARLRRRPR